MDTQSKIRALHEEVKVFLIFNSYRDIIIIFQTLSIIWLGISHDPNGAKEQQTRCPQKSTHVYEVQLKSSLVDQDTLMECEQMKFIFQHSPPSGSCTSSIDGAVLGSHWLKKLSIEDMTSS